MATQTLTTVQRDLVNGTCRPMIERFVLFCHELDAFVLEMDNQQDPITANGDDLGDGADGTAPRDDAPVLTGTLLAQLRTFAANMRAEVSDTALDTLVALCVRDVRTITRGR